MAGLWRVAFHSVHRHPVDDLARRSLVALEPCIADPVGEAVAAKARQSHQIDVLRVMAMLQMAHQTAECGGRHLVGKLIERICIRIHCSVILELSGGFAIGDVHAKVRSARSQGQDPRHHRPGQPVPRNAQPLVQGRRRRISRQHEPWRSFRSRTIHPRHSRDGKGVQSADRHPGRPARPQAARRHLQGRPGGHPAFGTFHARPRPDAG